MRKKHNAAPAAAAGTIQIDPQADRRASAQRAQAELIEMLARFVLAAIEKEQQRDGAIDSALRRPARYSDRKTKPHEATPP